jgi:release factor glutamine methyltransferase
MNRTLLEIVNEAKLELEFSDIYPLLAHALGKTKEFILTNPRSFLTSGEQERWEECVRRRKQGEPVAYILERKEFYSLSFRVTPDTLIPRPETELLVEEVIRRNPESLLDLGTGSGNIAVSVKYHLPGLRVVALDVSGHALRIARENADFLLDSHDIEFVKSDFFSELISQKFDIIVSNPPYIKSKRISQLQPEIREWEPRRALDGGLDGLDAYREILKDGWKFLKEGGFLLLEVDPDIIRGIESLREMGHYRLEAVHRDIGGYERMIVLCQR